MSDTLTERNFKAVSQAMHELNHRLSEATTAIADLRQMNHALMQRLASVEQQVQIVRARGMGRGPTT